MNDKMISARLPELTINQIKDLKEFYRIDLGDKFSTSRIIIICVNAFWKKIFETEHPLRDEADQARKNNSTV